MANEWLTLSMGKEPASLETGTSRELSRAALRWLLDTGERELGAGGTERALKAWDLAQSVAERLGQADLEMESAVRIGEALVRLNRLADARPRLDRAHALAVRRTETGDPTALRVLTIAAMNLASVLAVNGEVAGAFRILGEARRSCAALRARREERWLMVHLLSLALQAHDPGTALDTAAELVESLTHEAPAGEPESRPPAFEAVVESLLQLANACYYQFENWSACEQASRWVLRWAPRNLAATRLLGLALMQQRRFEEAAAIWDEGARSVQAAPEPERTDYEPTILANWAICLMVTRRYAEAEAVFDRSMKRGGALAHLLFQRAQARREQGKVEGALEDFRLAIQQAEAAARAGRPTQEPKSTVEPARDTPPQDLADLADLARFELVRCLESAQRDAEARDELEHLIQNGQARTSAHALRHRARAHGQAGRWREAAVDLGQAVQRQPDDHALRLALANALLESGSLDEAIAEFAALAPRHRAPKEALNGLNRILQIQREHPVALKWRGYARLELGDSQGATADLTLAIQRLPPDAEAHLWRGLARVTTEASSPEAAKVFRLPPDRIVDALEDLARALEIDPASDPARGALVWIADRALVDPRFYEICLLLPGGPGRLTETIPGFREAAGFMLAAHRATRERQWSEAIERWATARTALHEAGWPVLASWCRLRLVDLLLRSRALGEARRHLDEFGREFLETIAQPLSPAARAQPEAIRAAGADSDLAPTITIDLDHIGLIHLAADQVWLSQLLEAELLGRLGDARGAAAMVEKMAPWIEAARRGQGPLSPRLLINLAQALREAGDLRGARELLRDLDPRITDPEERASWANTMGTLSQLSGDHPQAVRYFRKALELADRLDAEHLSRLQLSVANSLVGSEAFAEAQPLIDQARSVLARGTAESAYDELCLKTLQAQVHEGLDHTGAALAEVLAAFDLAERFRLGFTQSEDRMLWMGKTGRLSDLAIRIALRHGDPETAFSVAERSRARALLDQLTARGRALPASATPLLRKKETWEGRVKALETLRAACAETGTGPADPALLRDLEDGDRLPDLFDDAPGPRRRVRYAKVCRELEDARQRLQLLQRNIQRARDAEAAQIVGATSSAAETAELLRGPEPADPRPPEVTEAVLVEFERVEDRLIAFGMRADGKIEATEIGVDWPRVEAFAETWSGDRDAEGQPVYVDTATLNDHLRPLLEPIRDWAPPDTPVWLVPNGVLHKLPLHAVEIDGIPLLARNPVSYTSSASILRFCRAVCRRNTSRALVIGDSLDNLTSARQEAVSVARRFGCAPLLGREASRSRVVDALRREGGEWELIHLACHARFDPGDPQRSGIVLAEDEASQGEGRTILSANEILDLELQTNLVVMGGCESGVNERRPGDELMGLTRAWLRAGAASVIASLWSVDDDSTGLLMQRFYDLWRGEPRRSKAAALREAALWVRGLTRAQLADLGVAQEDDAERPFEHFFHWAPFVLIGDWR